MIRCAVVPAAGLGTRFLAVTRGKPKEMIQILTLDKNGQLCFKPLLQVVFEELCELGVREFCFIINKSKNSIKTHFTLNRDLVKGLKEDNKLEVAGKRVGFYKKLCVSRFVFVNQPQPKGFGDAVLKAEPHVNETFLVHAGDNYFLSREHDYLKRLIRIHKEFKSDATFIVKEVDDSKSFGIVEGKEVSSGVYHVQKVTEKPNKGTNNLAITALYVFEPIIFSALRRTPADAKGEVQLTDAIQKLLNSGHTAMAVKLDADEHWFDIGTPQSYRKALIQTRKYFQRLENKKKILG